VIYFITDEDEKYIKIGYTESEKVVNRLGALQTGCPLKLKVFTKIDGGRHLENKLHIMFAKYQTVGEWFVLSDEVRAFICNLKVQNKQENEPPKRNY
jgi:hypothetical protein